MVGGSLRNRSFVQSPARFLIDTFGWYGFLGGLHADAGGQPAQIPGSGSYPLEWTLNGPGANLVDVIGRGGKISPLWCSLVSGVASPSKRSQSSIAVPAGDYLKKGYCCFAHEERANIQLPHTVGIQTIREFYRRLCTVRIRIIEDL